MTLPNADRAIVDSRKLTDYCLSPDHPRGRHKARLFESLLGLTAADAETLREALIHAAQNESAERAGEDEFGQRYVVEFEMDGPDGTALVRSAWIVRVGEDFPRFVSSYVVV